MLRFLAVRHLAVIHRVEVEFEPGLNIVTGETGAGKTMLVEAIDLLMGGRASADLVRTGEDLATVQAVLERPDGADMIIRREISAQGRSRAFIDDALATTAALRDLGARHLDLHGQHEHQTLLDPAEHVALLDAFAGHGPLAGEVSSVTPHGSRRVPRWSGRSSMIARSARVSRSHHFSFRKSNVCGPPPVRMRSLRRSDWSSPTPIGSVGSRDAYAALYDGEHAALASLALVWRRVGELAALDDRFASYVSQRDDIKPRLEDLAFVFGRTAPILTRHPTAAGRRDRLAALERLKRKFGPDLSDVLAREDRAAGGTCRSGGGR